MENNEITTAAENIPQGRAELLDVRINANAKVMASSMAEMGRDLKAMRDERLYKELNCDTFEEYCNEMTPIKQRMAYNFIKCWEKYGDELNVLSDIGITKLTLMTALDDDDREQLIESGDAETLSARELEKRVKELQNKNEQLTLELDEKTKEESAAELLKQRIERLNAELEATKAVQNQQKERADLLEKQNEELSKRPVEVAVEKPSKEEIKKITDKAKKEAAKETEKAVEAARKELADKFAAEIKVLRGEKEKLAAEKAELQSIAKKAPPDSQKERLKFYLEELQRNFNSAIDAVNAFPEDEREKPINVLKAVVNKMGGLLE